MKQRPKKLKVLTKQQIDVIVAELFKYGYISINNFVVLELVDWVSPRTYYNLHSKQKQVAPRQRLSIRKAKYLKDSIKKKGI